MARSFVIVPGIGDSGSEHWQSHWEAMLPSAIRIKPDSWDVPDLENWIVALDGAIAKSTEPPVLVCHSLGCLLFAHWLFVNAKSNPSRQISGVFMVAIPDKNSRVFPPSARAFGDLPKQSFGDLPVLAIASADDPFDPEMKGLSWAKACGATPILLGLRGHLNEMSGLADWQEGYALLTAFLTSLERKTFSMRT